MGNCWIVILQYSKLIKQGNTRLLLISGWNLTAKSIRGLGNNVFIFLERLELGAVLVEKDAFLWQSFVNHHILANVRCSLVRLIFSVEWVAYGVPPKVGKL